ncbi:MAG: CRISPR-associated endonuclease Cas3'' [Nitrososphaerales archaeon]
MEVSDMSKICNLKQNCHFYGKLCSPPLPSFYSERQPKECYVEHVFHMVECWKDKLSKRYEPTLLRILSSAGVTVDLDSLMKSIFLFHDLGKLTENYKKSYLKGHLPIRHEFLGGYFVYTCLKDTYEEYVAMLASASILMHHEYWLRGLVERTMEKGIRISVIRREFESKIDVFHFVPNSINAIKELVKYFHLKINEERLKEPSVDDVVDALKAVTISLDLAGDIHHRHRNRLLVSALQHILVICDYKSARLGRAEDIEDDQAGSTFARLILKEVKD